MSRIVIYTLYKFYPEDDSWKSCKLNPRASCVTSMPARIHLAASQRLSTVHTPDMNSISDFQLTGLLHVVDYKFYIMCLVDLTIFKCWTNWITQDSVTLMFCWFFLKCIKELFNLLTEICVKYVFNVSCVFVHGAHVFMWWRRNIWSIYNLFSYMKLLPILDILFHCFCTLIWVWNLVKSISNFRLSVLLHVVGYKFYIMYVFSRGFNHFDLLDYSRFNYINSPLIFFSKCIKELCNFSHRIKCKVCTHYPMCSCARCTYVFMWCQENFGPST